MQLDGECGWQESDRTEVAGTPAHKSPKARKAGIARVNRDRRRGSGHILALAGHYRGLALDSYLLVLVITIIARLQAAFARGAGSNGWMNPCRVSYEKISTFVRSAFTLLPMAIPFPTPDPLFV